MFEFIPARLVLAIISFFGFINLYFMRFNFSVITVAMITPNQGNPSCESNNGCQNLTTTNSTKTTLDWDERQRALVLSVFNYGYCLTQVLGGRIAELYGAKYLFGPAVVIPGILNILIPVAAKLDFWAVVAIRFIQGLIQGVSWPSMHALTPQWFPLEERSRFIGTIFFATNLGIVFIMPFSGFLCDVLSWEEAFYLTSTFPLIWGVLWFTLIHSKPKYHPRISKEEKNYIETAVNESGIRENTTKSLPWKSIIKSLPYLAIVVCDVGNSYALTMFAYQMPNYMKSVFNRSVAKTGFLAGLPFLFRYCGSVTFSVLADFIISRKYLSVATTRRIFSGFAMFGPATMLTLLTLFFLENIYAFVTIICISMFLNGSIASSKLVNLSDIAPNYAGTLFGVSNTLSSVATFTFLLVSGEILSQGQTVQQWSILYWTCVPVLVLSEAFFLIYMSGTPQKWNFL